MRYSLLAIAVLFVLGGVVATNSQSEGVLTAGELLTKCTLEVRRLDGVKLEKVSEALDVALCSAYLLGFNDGIRVESTLRFASGGRICLPKQGITHNQLVRVVVKWLRENPENLQRNARVEVYIAIGKAFPCTESNQP